MGKKYLGIDVEDRFLKIVVMKDRRVLNTYLEIMPDNMVIGGRIAAFHALADYLREVVRKNKIRVKDAAVVLPSETYYIRRVHLPKMTAAQLQINLPYEFHDYLQEDTDQYVFDYSVLSVDEKEMELLIAALSKQQVEEYKEMCKRAGLRLCKLVPDVLTIQEIVLPPEDPVARKKRLAEEEKSRNGEKKEESRNAAREKKQRARDRKKNGLSVEELAQRAAAEAKAKGLQTGSSIEAADMGTNAGNLTAGAAGQIPGGGTFPGTVPKAGSSVGGVFPGRTVSEAGSAVFPGGPQGALAGNAAGTQDGQAAGPAGTTAGGNTASGGVGAGTELQTGQKKDYAVLGMEYSRVRLHFFSGGAYEITRNLGTTEKQICELIAQEKGVDVHIAQLMCDRNQDGVLELEDVADLMQALATEVMRVMNFYNYNNPRNTIDAIYYYGRESNPLLLDRIQSVTELAVRPLTELIQGDDEGQQENLLMMLQGYGAVLE